MVAKLRVFYPYITVVREMYMYCELVGFDGNGYNFAR